MFPFFTSLFGGNTTEKLAEAMKKNPFLVDVRTPGEYAQGHPKGSINIPLDAILSQLARFKEKETIVVFCRSGNRSGQAKAILEANGIKGVVNGGTWKDVASFTG